METTFVNDSGYTISFWASGMMTFGLCVVVANLKILMISTNHSLLSIFVLAASLLSYLFSIFIASVLPENQFYKILERYLFLWKFQLQIFRFLSCAYLHFGNILIICCTNLIDYAFTLHSSTFYFLYE